MNFLPSVPILLVAGLMLFSCQHATGESADEQSRTSSEDEPAECGCGATPRCGEACTTECGCCFCAVGTSYCSGDSLLTCNSPACFEVAQQCQAGACVSSLTLGSFCVDDLNDCSAIRTTYLEAAASAELAPIDDLPLEPGPHAYNCSPELGCDILPGHCEIGLGSCAYLAPKPAPELARLAELYIELGCSQEVDCECAEPPANVDCDASDSGSWKPQDGFVGGFACVVQ